MSGPEIRISGEKVSVYSSRSVVAEAPLAKVVEQLQRSAGGSRFAIRPASARVWEERGDAVAAAFELPPHARTVRWLADDSKAPFGPKASYRQYYVSFPFVIVLIVFRGGALTGEQQLYYRRESLDTGEDLLLSNLYNVAVGYGQQSWLCLQHVPDLSEAGWPEKVSTIVDHIFTAAFNRSSEEHEGNSYWTPDRVVDPRVASMKAWQEATQENRRLAVEIPWQPANTTVSAELGAMLDRVVKSRSPSNATELAGWVTKAGRRTRRPA